MQSCKKIGLTEKTTASLQSSCQMPFPICGISRLADEDSGRNLQSLKKIVQFAAILPILRPQFGCFMFLKPNQFFEKKF